MDQLQPPGAGLPVFEKAYLNVFFRIGTAIVSDNRASKIFRTEADELIRMFDASDLDDVTEQVLIPRIQGIEDSSRNWSIVMVLHHLCLVDREIMTAISALKKGIVPRGEVAIEYYKPDPRIGLEIIDEFNLTTDLYEQLIGSYDSLRTPATYVHPWFGRLDAHGWHCLAAVHHRIHRRQARKILALLGVA